MNVLVLYSRFAGYVKAAFSHYQKIYGGEIHIVRYATDKNAPFVFQNEPNLFYYDRTEIGFEEIQALVTEKDIKVLICSGWGDSLYRKVSKWVKDRGILTICVADNQWMGTLRQRFLTGISPFVIRNRFCKMWVPVTYQFEYARRLGFERYDIMLRYYSADTNLFVSKDDINVPKRFIYVGRLLEIKGVEILFNALVSLIPELKRNGWKFLVVGSGERQDDFENLAKQHDCIEYYPFLQPIDLAQKTADGGIFVLPSNYDAWGVVVHEYAIFGSPMLMSEAVGSRSAFLMQGYNGELFETGSVKSLQEKALHLMGRSVEELNIMGRRSQQLAAGYNLDIWASTLQSAITDFYSGVKHKSLKRTKYQ